MGVGTNITAWSLGAVVMLAVALLAGPAGAQQTGIASHYSELSVTASGRSFSPSAMVAAHRSLPFGTRVRVDNLSNGRSTVVTIVDRGPFIGGRIIDLSVGAARTLGFAEKGLQNVRVTVLGRDDTGTLLASAPAKRRTMQVAAKSEDADERPVRRQRAATPSRAPVATESRRTVQLASASDFNSGEYMRQRELYWR